MDPMEAIRATFFQECEEQLSELETGLLALEAGETDLETINAVFRAVHSVKGGAGAFNLDALVRFAHVFETALDQMRSGKLAPEPERIRVMLRAADVLADLVRAARDGGEVDQARSQALCAELEALGGGPPAAAEDDGDLMEPIAFTPLQVMVEAPPPPPEGEAVWIIRFSPRRELYANGNDATLLLRELGRLGAVEARIEPGLLPPLDALDPEGAYAAWHVRLTTEVDEAAIREVFDFVEGDCELSIVREGAEPPPPPPGDEAEPPAAPEFDIEALLASAKATAAGEAPIVSTADAPLVAAPPAEPALHVPPPPSDQAAKGGGAGAPTIRVDLDRVDRLIDLVGELVINQAMLAQRVIEAGLTRASGVATGLDELEQLTREIQDSVMAIRAQPVKSVFQRMPRLVREVAALVGKQVRLVTEGEGVEVDKTVIERLADPLTHMIRNAIDHGLESPEKRVDAGKPAEGVVRLSAQHRSGRIVIEISDDGAGINRSRVRAIAVERGLIAADAVLTDDETDNLIFMPGFSTAETVSDISGRGVGMDVVRRSIQALGGRISIASRPGLGSTFTLSLPLTLAVLDGMVVTVAGQTLVCPLGAIVETLQPAAREIHPLGGGARTVLIRDTYVPLIDVGQALGYRAAPYDPSAGVVLFVEADGGARAALLVDAIQGQRQVVIKSLEANYRPVDGIAAATILGDGRVALILDTDALLVSARSVEPPFPTPVLAAAE